MLYAVIVAGGQGTRLWPISRKSSPKQVRPFVGDTSMLQKTYERISKLVPPSHIYIETNARYAEDFLQQIPELDSNHLILEPVPRNTAPAVGLAAAVINQLDPEAIMINVWADHYYDDEAGYLKNVQTAVDALKQYPDHLVTMPAKPTYPSSAFDYFEVGEKLTSSGSLELFRAKAFARKPDLETAKKYLAQPSWYWNTANFVWRTDTLMKMFEEHAPAMYAGLHKMAGTWGTDRWEATVSEVFPTLESNTIDYTIFEKTDKIILAPANVGWRDVGNWKIIHEMLTKVENSDVIMRGRALQIDTKNSLIFNENKDKLVAVVGMDDVVVIDTPDALLVMKKSQDQDVKKVIQQLQEAGDEKIL